MDQVRLKTTNILKLNRRKNTHKKWKRAKLILQFNSSDLLSSSFLITGPSGSAGDSTSTKSINENSTAVHTFTANENVTWSLSSASISNTENFFKSGEVKDGGLGDIVLTFKTQAENPLLDVGGNTDGTKGFKSLFTYSYNSSQDKFVQIDSSGLQNGSDYRGKTTTRWRGYWIDEWNGTVAIDVEDILRYLFEALAIRYISMAPFLTSRVSLLSLSDKSTGDVLGHVGDVRRGLRHWVFLFVELHVEGPHSAFYGWWT